MVLMMRRILVGAQICLVAGLVGLIAGCGDSRKTAKVSGKATLDGKPIAGTVFIVPTDGSGMDYAQIEADGSFILKKAFVGPSKMYVQPAQRPPQLSKPGEPPPGTLPPGVKLPDLPPDAPKVPEPPGPAITREMEEILAHSEHVPDAYRSLIHTPVELTVQPGENTLDLTMNSLPSLPRP